MTDFRFTPSLAILCTLYVVVSVAPLLAPYDPEVQHRDAPLAPPTSIHVFVDHTWTLTRPYVRSDAGLETPIGTVRGASSRFPIRLWATVESEGLNGLRVRRTHLFGVDEPGRLFLLGTDRHGRDRFSRLLTGARVSLGGGLLAAALAVALGLLLGGFAGARGGVADRSMMRAAEVFLAVPWLYLLLAIRAALPLDLSPSRALLALGVTIGLAGWARPAMLVRGVVLGGRSRVYVEAARSLGASEWFVFRRHVLPQASHVAVTQAAILAPQFTLAEMTLSFFGLGVTEPAASWGTLLAEISREHLLQPTWYALAPLVAVVAVFVLYQRVADTLTLSASSVTA